MRMRRSEPERVRMLRTYRRRDLTARANARIYFAIDSTVRYFWRLSLRARGVLEPPQLSVMRWVTGAEVHLIIYVQA